MSTYPTPDRIGARERVLLVLALLFFCTAAGAAALLPAGARNAADVPRPSSIVTGNTATPLIQAINHGLGPGVEGDSGHGTGVVGTTKHETFGPLHPSAGVLGQDFAMVGSFNDGVRGVSLVGTGVAGVSTAGVGVQAMSEANVGLVARSGMSAAVDAVSTESDGLFGGTKHRSRRLPYARYGVFGYDESSDEGRLNAGVYGASGNGIGVSARSYNWIGLHVRGGATCKPRICGSVPALSAVAASDAVDAIDACASSALTCDRVHSVFSVNASGDVHIAGRIYTSGSCTAGCSIESVGEARMVDGQAYVALDPAIARAIDDRSPYVVFVTPEGDSRGVFVASKTRRGFSIKENQNGRDSFTLSYRIVAVPR